MYSVFFFTRSRQQLTITTTCGACWKQHYQCLCSVVGISLRRDDTGSPASPLLADCDVSPPLPCRRVFQPHSLSSGVCPPHTVSFAFSRGVSQTSERVFNVLFVTGAWRRYVGAADGTDAHPPSSSLAHSISSFPHPLCSPSVQAHKPKPRQILKKSLMQSQNNTDGDDNRKHGRKKEKLGCSD